MWHLIPQTETEGRGKAKVTKEVMCKKINFLPITDKKTGDKRFMKLKKLVLKVKLRHEKESDETEHSITYSQMTSRDALQGEEKLFGKYIYHWPSKGQGKNEFTNMQDLHKFLANRGPIADAVCEAFTQRLREFGVLPMIEKVAA